ncbi:MAG TPA: BrnT family toxin [Armatimonadota bacterium]|jgi:uncharacterized DUF497 family protein
MFIKHFYATAKARKHIIDKHGVNLYEVEEVLAGDPTFWRIADVDGERRYRLIGQSAAGRRLKVYVARESDDTMRLITAYEVRR